MVWKGRQGRHGQDGEGQGVKGGREVTSLLLTGIVVDIREKVKKDPTAELMADDLMEWMDEHGPLPDGAVVLVLTGWGDR